jgi:hypothetical protein
VAAEDSNAKRRRELEEVLELRRSFGTLGRRLVKRQTPIRSGVGPSLVELLAQAPKATPNAGTRPAEEQRPEPDQNEQPEPADELGHEPELDREPEQDQQPESDQEHELVQEGEPEQDQAPAEPPEPEPAPDQGLDQRPEAEPLQQPELAQQPDEDSELDRDAELDDVLDQEVDRVSTTVRRATPVVDESYRVQAPPAPAEKQFRIPEPPAARRRPTWQWLVALVAVFALGLAVDHAVLAPAPRPAQAASTQPPSAAPTTPPSSAAPARPQSSVPQSCLATAQLGDRLIDLLVHKARGIDVTKALAAYTKASQNCRKEASSR